MSVRRNQIFTDSKLHGPAPARATRTPIGQILVEMGALSHKNLILAAAMRQREDVRIGDILLAHGMVDEDTLYFGIAQQYNATVADFDAVKPDVRLIDRLGADACLKQGILPWRQVGGSVIISSCKPELFEDMRAELTEQFGPVRMAVTSEKKLHAALLRSRHRQIAAAAETRVAAYESCRVMDVRRFTRTVVSALLAGLALAIYSPDTAIILLTAWAVLTLVVTSGLKLAATITHAKHSYQKRTTFTSSRHKNRLPIVSVMVPLFKEREIAGRLVKRLSRLDYPRELLDICLVVEEDDAITQDAVARANLPHWMRQIVVPRGGVKTKPRALNIALDFCRGSIVGIYDAEDAPEPSQIHKVAAHFAQADPDVACVQGILDFYNARTNWLSRCFTVEYATWFRVILRGYSQMGLVIPLGGTTLFFRRDAIEKLGRWDAHNVTEDADLGIRLARHGYRTELIHTVTEEEANCRFWPWVKQRSRWLKGYAMTWVVHNRDPIRLWKDLGAWKFFGVQALFLGALSQMILAPFLWSFWALPLGLPHPLVPLLSKGMFYTLSGIFIFSEVVTIAAGLLATSGPKHRWLWGWVPTLHLYFPLATLAAIKGLWEMITNPFYWDKTVHGIDDAGFYADADAEEVTIADKVAPLPSNTDFPHKPPMLELRSEFRIHPAAPVLKAENATPKPFHKHDPKMTEFAEEAAAFDHKPTSNTQTVDIATGAVRRLTFGLDLTDQTLPTSAPQMPALKRALRNAEAHFDEDRMQPAPKPAARQTSFSESRPHSASNSTGNFPQKITNPLRPIAHNFDGHPNWAHVAAFTQYPIFIEHPPESDQQAATQAT